MKYLDTHADSQGVVAGSEKAARAASAEHDRCQTPRRAMGIDECVNLLRGKTDEQQFVGLLLATKLMREPADLTRIFEAGLPFVRRLLRTPPGAAASSVGVDGASYRSLALSVLASFCADPHLAARPELADRKSVV